MERFLKCHSVNPKELFRIYYRVGMGDKKTPEVDYMLKNIFNLMKKTQLFTNLNKMLLLIPPPGENSLHALSSFFLVLALRVPYFFIRWVDSSAHAIVLILTYIRWSGRNMCSGVE